jgi:signal transduction histidine kinase
MLLVKDDDVDRLALLRFVERTKLNYSLQVATSLAEARTILAAQSFEIVLLDPHLPDGSSVDLLDAVGTAPVIFITGAESPKLAVRAMKLGASDYLLKDPNRSYLNLLPVAVQRASRQKQAEKERAQLQARLCQAQKLEALGTLAGGFAHEFNNLLGIILSNIELSKLDLPAGTDASENLSEALKAGHRARETVRRILAFSLTGEEQRQVISLDTMVTDALQLLRAILPITVSIETDFEFRSAMIMINRAQIQQALVNICNNAWQAMPAATGKIRVSESVIQIGPGMAEIHPNLLTGRYARLSLADNGAGMDEATLARVLEPFFTTKAPLHQGLGMAVVHGIMTAHHGAVVLESELGAGTKVHLYFPTNEKPELEEEKISGGRSSGGTEQRMLIDDEPV